MSADNFYVLRNHPEGGVTLVMGFASSDEPHDGVSVEVRHGDDRFPTVKEALKAYSAGQAWVDEYYPRYFSEYGLMIHPEIFERSDTGGDIWAGVDADEAGVPEVCTEGDLRSPAEEG